MSKSHHSLKLRVSPHSKADGRAIGKAVALCARQTKGIRYHFVLLTPWIAKTVPDTFSLFSGRN